jgi:hypothetical protein
MQYEYHVMGAKDIKEIQSETDKRAEDGWELNHVYQETSGGLLFFLPGRQHVLIFRRQREGASARA